MKRSRPKGDADPAGKEFPWDEALDTTAAAMLRIEDRRGPEAKAFSSSLSVDDRRLGDAGGLDP